MTLAFPDSANAYDILAEAYMTNSDDDLAIQYYKKILEMIPKDIKADKEFLKRLTQGALERQKSSKRNNFTKFKF